MSTPAWHRHMSLRVRMVVIAVVTVALLVTICGLLVVVMVRTELLVAADDVGEVRAEQVAELARLDVLPTRIAETDDLEAAVQVVVNGAVVSATVNAMTRDIFAGVPLQRPDDDVVVERATLPIAQTGPFRVTAVGVQTPRGNATVYVAVDVEDINAFVSALVKIGGASLLGLMVAVALLLWVVIGRTLSPIADIRRRAETISDHHQLHQRVPEPDAYDEIGLLARTLNAMLARLEASAHQQERFVADAAHELRSPLASTRARLETALSGHAAAREHEPVLRDVLMENLRMSSLVNRLLLLARTDAGAEGVDAVPVDLDDLVREVTSGFRMRNVHLVQRIKEPAQVLGEPALLEQVLHNLIENAVRHARSHVEITLTADRQHGVLTVDDDGVGIPPEKRDQVFQRFVRLDDSRRRESGGAGLGLAIVWQIVQAHHGTVEVKDSPTGGARLRVFLPLLDQTADQKSATEATEAPAANR